MVGKPSQRSIRFAGKTGAYPNVEQLKCASLWLDPALLANIRLGWTRFSGTNALAYYENL